MLATTSYEIARAPTSGSSRVFRVVAREVGTDGVDIGSCAGWCRARKASGGARTEVVEVFVSSLEVKETYRRRGVGRSLVEAVEAIGASERGATRSTLSVNKWNTNALKMYERLGFEYDETPSLGEMAMDPLRLVQHRMSRSISRGD